MKTTFLINIFFIFYAGKTLSQSLPLNYFLNKIIIEESKIGLHALFYEKGKWGLLNYSDGRIIFDALFEKKSEVPYKVDSWRLKIMNKIKKNLNADIILVDFNNGDGVIKARIKKTKKCGMYQTFDNKEYKALIPPDYDSIDFFKFNYVFTTVYKNGKVGVYTSKWVYGDNAKETVKCIYDN